MSRVLTKRWAIALVASLALNLFLGGMFTARFIMRPPRPHHGFRPLQFKSMRRHLDASSHELVDRIEAKHEEQLKRRMGEAREARHAAREALSAEEFDEAKARAALAEFRAKWNAAQEAADAALIELAAALPPDQRSRLAKAWGKRGGKRGRRGPRDGGLYRGPPDGGDDPPPPSPPE